MVSDATGVPLTSSDATGNDAIGSEATGRLTRPAATRSAARRSAGSDATGLLRGRATRSGWTRADRHPETTRQSGYLPPAGRPWGDRDRQAGNRQTTPSAGWRSAATGDRQRRRSGGSRSARPVTSSEAIGRLATGVLERSSEAIGRRRDRQRRNRQASDRQRGDRETAIGCRRASVRRAWSPSGRSRSQSVRRRPGCGDLLTPVDVGASQRRDRRRAEARGSRSEATRSACRPS